MVTRHAARSTIQTLLCLCALWLATAIQNAHGADFNANVDRSELALDEHVMLTLTLSNSDTRLRAQGVNPNVDLSILTKDFHVGSPRDSHRYNIYRGQGRSTSELVVELFPKRIGNVTVPTFQVDGLSTAPIQLTVRPSPQGTAPLAFAKVSVNTSSPWQQEQLVAYLDVYSRIELESAQLGGELMSEPHALDQFEYRRLPVQTRSEQHEGFSYRVMRTAWALFPTRDGPLRLQFPETWIVAKDGNKLRLPGERLDVTIRALPADIAPGTLVGKPQLSLTPTRQGMTTNDLYAWQLELRAAAPSTVVPKSLELRPVKGLQLYVDRPLQVTEESATGLTQVARYSLSAFALQAGSYRLPDIQVSYFDTASGTQQVTTAPGPEFAVQSGPAGASPAAPPAPSAPPGDVVRNGSAAWPWILACASLLALWLITLAAWLRQRPTNRQATDAVTESRRGNPSRPLEADLLKAFGTPSLAAGLCDFETRHGINEELRATVQSVQRLYYSPQCGTAASDLHEAVGRAVQLIRSVSSQRAATSNPWLPNQFSPAKSLHQSS